VNRTPIVSFVVVNWRAEDATARCVESIRTQRGLDPIAVEIVVVDNESSPGSLEALAALDVSVVASLRNTGFAGGANLGIERAGGRYVAIVNNDAVLDADWAARGVEILEADPSIGLVGGADLAWTEDHPAGDLRAARVTAPRIDPVSGFAEACSAARPLGDVLALNGSNLMARAAVLARLRGFDTAFFAYYEDTDLSARVWAVGHRVVFAPDMLVWHRRNLSSDRVPFRKFYLAYRNHMRVVAKHFPEPTWRPAVRRAAIHNLLSALTGRTAGSPASVDGPRRRAHLAAGTWGLANGLRLSRTRRDAMARGEHYSGFAAHADRDARALHGAPG
jgi:GT2 family glycosyltransferase